MAHISRIARSDCPEMVTHFHSLASRSDLREFVYATLCEIFQLQIGAFPITEKVLNRAGKPCGIYFCLQGPRAVRFTAIWETERNQVLFYGPSGERILKRQLIEGPQKEYAAA
jgi:hypothetical protein